MASTALGVAFRHLRELYGTGTATGLEDAQLLARYAGSRDEVAFEALVVRHGPMVLATCRAVLRSEQDVEDAFQSTFLVLARKARSIRGGDALCGWLHRVAYRAAVQASVEAKKRRRKEAEASAMAPLHASRGGLATEDDLAPVLHEEIDRLPDSQRARKRAGASRCDAVVYLSPSSGIPQGFTLSRVNDQVAVVPELQQAQVGSSFA